MNILAVWIPVCYHTKYLRIWIIRNVFKKLVKIGYVAVSSVHARGSENCINGEPQNMVIFTLIILIIIIQPNKHHNRSI